MVNIIKQEVVIEESLKKRLDLKYFKQQYDSEVKSGFKVFNLSNKKDKKKTMALNFKLIVFL